MKGWKRGAHLAGTGVAICGIYFVFVQLRKYGADIDMSSLSRGEWVSFSALALVGVGMNVCLAMAWRALLQSAGAIVPIAWALSTYGMAHLARYVPGNVFHYAGRQAIGMAAGVPGRALAKASFLELALVAFTGGLVSLVSLPLVCPAVPGGLSFSLVALAIFVTAFCIKRFIGQAVVTAFCFHLVYLSMSGLTFLAVAAAHDWNSIPGHDWLAICGAYIAAWLIGMLTPGAPAGLGVRELVLLYLLKGRLAGSMLIFAVLITRVIAVMADVMSFIIALMMQRGGAKRTQGEP